MTPSGANESDVSDTGTVVTSTVRLAVLVRNRRTALGLTQADLAGLGGVGNRFIVDLERGKPTLQLQKVLMVLDLLGLEVALRPRSTASAR